MSTATAHLRQGLSRRSQQAKANSGGQATKPNNELSQLKRVVYKEQLSTLRVIDELVELEKSQAYLKYSSSLYSYLTVQLRYSEGAAMRRLNAARVIGRFPEVRKLLQCREVSLCTLSLVSSECKKEGGKALIEEIRGKKKREVEALLAFRKRDEGKAPMKEQIRVISPRTTAATTTKLAATPCRSSEGGRGKEAVLTPVASISPIYRLSFTATADTYELYQEVRNGLSHRLGGVSDPVAQVFEAGLKLLKKELGKKRSVKAGDKKTVARLRKNSGGQAAKNGSRYVSAALKRTIFEKGNCQCQYRLEDGSVCGSEFQLELDHVTPFSLGGETTEENLRVLCWKHNQFAAKEAGLL